MPIRKCISDPNIYCSWHCWDNPTRPTNGRAHTATKPLFTDAFTTTTTTMTTTTTSSRNNKYANVPIVRPNAATQSNKQTAVFSAALTGAQPVWVQQQQNSDQIYRRQHERASGANVYRRQSGATTQLLLPPMEVAHDKGTHNQQQLAALDAALASQVAGVTAAFQGLQLPPTAVSCASLQNTEAITSLHEVRSESYDFALTACSALVVVRRSLMRWIIFARLVLIFAQSPRARARLHALIITRRTSL